MTRMPAARKWLILIYVGCVIFFVAVRCFDRHWMSLLMPVLYADGFNLVTWIARWSGWLQLVSSTRFLALFLDAGFAIFNIAVPLLALRKSVNALVLILLALNFVYVGTVVSMGLHTYESLMSYLFLPILFFQVKSERWLVLYAFMRYFFLFYFFSAGAWKLVRGSLFLPGNMQAILLLQHQDILELSPASWQALLYSWLIEHPGLCDILFWSAGIFELSFVVGFFTSRYDRFLLFLYLLFMIADVLFMRILFLETIPFAMLLLFSRTCSGMTTDSGIFVEPDNITKTCRKSLLE